MAHTIADADQMREFGAQLAALLRGGDLVVLTGPLGAGKTTLVQGIARGLGIADPITSPTFVVERRHRAGARGIGLVHVDAYRLAGATDLADLDVDDPSSVCVVEWGGPFAAGIAPAWLEVRIDRSAAPEGDPDPAGGVREVSLEWHGQEARA